MPGQRLNSQARNLVANLIGYFTAERDNKGPLISLNAVQERVANALKISMRTVSSIKVASDKNEVLTTPGKYRPRKKAKTQDLHESYKMDVRNTVYDMYAEKKNVTIKNLKEELRQKGIVDASYGTLRTLLHHLGFKFKKDDNRKALTETPRIAYMRAEFLRKYMENKNSNSPRTLVFVDETSIYSKAGQIKTGQDEAHNPKNARKPAGLNGKRFIVIHAGSIHGFVKNSSLVVASKSKLADDHGDMNADVFINWVQNQLIPNLETPSLIIMDNASYHNVEVERQPSCSWSKEEVLAWLDEHNVPYTAHMLKAELVNVAKRHKKTVNYKVDQLLHEHGHDVLRVPPYHCEFNTIEMIWADAKSCYNEHLGEEALSDAKVLETWDKALQKCTPEVWYDKVRYTENLIEKWYEREKILEEIPEIMFNIDSEEESDEEYSSSSD